MCIFDNIMSYLQTYAGLHPDCLDQKQVTMINFHMSLVQCLSYSCPTLLKKKVLQGFSG